MRAIQHALSVLSAFALVSTVSVDASADDSVSRAHQQTTPAPLARFEILQSTIAAKLTFRLDRFNGRVWQLVRTKDDDNTWDEMEVFQLPKIQSATRPRFQLFTSGIAARHTFLFDGDTGKSWVVTVSKRKTQDGSTIDVNTWQPFAD